LNMDEDEPETKKLLASDPNNWKVSFWRERAASWRQGDDSFVEDRFDHGWNVRANQVSLFCLPQSKIWQYQLQLYFLLLW
jgi:hypothetical protein